MLSGYSPQDALKVGDVQDVVRRNAVAQAVQINPGRVSAGARRALDAQEHRLDVGYVDHEIGRGEAGQRRQITGAVSNDITQPATEPT